MLNRGLDKQELLRVVDSVATEKSIDKEIILNSMETAIQKAAYSRFGSDNEIEATINRDNGSIKIKKVLQIVEKVEDPVREISLKDASLLDKKNKDLKVGDKIYEELPQVDFGRIAAQSAKQIISQRVREAEKNRQYEDFINKQGQILSGIIKRLEYGNVIVDLGKAESVIRKEELIPREILKNGDRVKAFCYEVKKDIKGHQIFLSRAHPQFLAALFFQEVPEIYEGIIEIKSVSRDPGSRAKICVNSKDSSLDPVGACVGMRGSRVQTVVNELHGEKIDIIKWTEDLPTLVAESLSPAEIQKVLIDEQNKRIDVILSEENLSKAIGRRGQNVRLASQLTGWDIDIMTEEEESDKRNEEFRTLSQLFVDGLDVDEVIAQLLVTEGFSSVEEVAFIPVEELAAIEGFDEDVCKELRERARQYLEVREADQEKQRKDMGISDEIAEMESLTGDMLLKLGETGIKTLDDLADLAGDELMEVVGGKALTEDQANEIIMAARAHWFEGEERVEPEVENTEDESKTLEPQTDSE